MRRSPWLVLAVLSASLAGPRLTRADDPPPVPAPPLPVAETPDDEKRESGDDKPVAHPVPAGLEFRIYDVSALAAGVPTFLTEKGPFPVPSDQVNDEEHPMFGGESEETVKPAGSIDDLIESIRVLDPKGFDREGMSVGALGWGRIAVRAPAAFHELAAKHFAEVEHRVLSAVMVDVLALRGEASSALDGGLAAAVGRGALVPLVGARAVGYPLGSAVARFGADVAYVQDEDVEVAEKSKIPDPIVGIAREGIAFRADIHQATAERILIDLTAWWASAGKLTRVNIQPSGDPVETVESDGRAVDGVLALAPGVWSVLSSTGDISFAVRATVRAHDLQGTSPKSVWTTRALVSRGPLARRTIDVGDLLVRPQNSRGSRVQLSPSNYTPPEPPELREPTPLFPIDELVSTLRQNLDSDYWSAGGVELDVANGQVRISADQDHTKAVMEVVDGVRAGLGRSTRLRATVVTLPLASMPEYLGGLDDGATMLADGGKALLARAGAEIIDRGGLRCRPMQRVATTGGRFRSYVADYDVEIAADSSIGNPIVRSVLDGSSFDVDCRLAAGGAEASIDLRFDRSTWRSSRQVKTGSGDIECPNIGLSRIRGSTLIPLGQLRIVGATLEAGVVTLTILSANAD